METTIIINCTQYIIQCSAQTVCRSERLCKERKTLEVLNILAHETEIFSKLPSSLRFRFNNIPFGSQLLLNPGNNRGSTVVNENSFMLLLSNNLFPYSQPSSFFCSVIYPLRLRFRCFLLSAAPRRATWISNMNFAILSRMCCML